jgi:hypothetical protein
MSRKLITSTCFLVLFFLLLPGEAAAKSQPVYIYLDLDFRMAGDLTYSLKYLKKDVIKGMEKGFSDNGLLVVKKTYPIDYKLEGTIEVKHFIKSSASYSIIFEAKHFEISAARYRRSIPPLIFTPFKSRDRTGGVKPAQDLDDAIDLALEDFLWVMNQSKVFAFQDHPIFAKGVKISRKDIKKIKKKEDFDRMADRIIKELKKAIDAAVKARISQLPQPKVKIIDNSKEYNRIVEELEKLKNQRGPVETKNKELEKLRVKVDKLIYINHASIIIKTNALNRELDTSFAAVIIPRTSCDECREKRINAVCLGRVSSEEDYDKFFQEQKYRIPYRMEGELVVEKEKVKEKVEEKLKIKVSKDDFKKILDIDSNGRLEKGTIIKSVSDENLYPRILVDIRK